jgi:alkylation response protein AidB-like acyl-CoA dehydrogenase
MSDFFQSGPAPGHPYRDDGALRAALRRLLPGDVRRQIEPGLERLGERAAGEIAALGDRAEREPPRHVPFDAWGRRVDRIEVSPAWQALHAIAAEEGVVATAYERRHGAWSRLEQCARLYLFHPSSAVASCPLAMTDGAARVLAALGDDDARARVLPRLTSRDPAVFWTSGQWMTERAGGSDVAGTATVARRDGEGFRLYGEKWFTSATTAEIALALGRIEGAPEGSRGLTLFLLELRDEGGALRGIRVERLKDKLGTRALPTAELTLEGAPARRLGEEGRGVATVATMLNITRYYNATCAAASMARGLQLATDYAARRLAFGKRLIDHPLHRETLAELAAEHQLALQLVLRTAGLLGREEAGEASGDERALLRLLTPLVKLLTGKQAVASASEALECFGGAGYIEDTGVPRLLRDAQVLSIWEGTTNVLALDALRAMAREDALAPLAADATRRLAGLPAALAAPAGEARATLDGLSRWLAAAREESQEALERGARRFALGLGRVYGAALLLEQAAWEGSAGLDSGAHQAARRTLAMLREWAAPAREPSLRG